jgi:hypothetical protein
MVTPVDALGGSVEIKAMLDELLATRTVYVNSSPALANGVRGEAENADKKLAEKSQEIPRRKNLVELPQHESLTSIEVSPIEVLHQLGRATVLTGQGASRGIAEHWGCLKYCQALCGHENGTGAMALSAEGLKPVHHHKTVQSEELGIGFAIVVALRILARRFPHHSLTVIDADVALSAGWAIRGREVTNRDDVQLRPDYFIEARPPRGPSKLVVLECKGTYQQNGYFRKQLAKASSQVEAVHLAGRGALPSLAIGTELRAKAGITVNVLDPDGDGTLDLVDDNPELAFNSEADQKAIAPLFKIPVVEEGGRRRSLTVNGFQIKPEHYAWFAKILARTAAAGLMAFCGERMSAAPYLTKRQGSDRYKELVYAGTGSLRDVEHEINGLPFVGTDQVFRLNKVRIEAFSGMSQPLFERLHSGDVASYRRQAPDVFQSWAERRQRGYGGWDGPVSVDADGSIMALRILPNGG